jgi:tetratricopeptide (TPR) repeat protein
MIGLKKNGWLVGLLLGLLVSGLIFNWTAEQKKWAIAWAEDVRLSAPSAQAAEAWRQLQARYPDDPTIEVKLIEVLLAAGEVTAAETHWQALLQVESLSPEIRQTLSGLLHVAGRHEEAYEQMKQAWADAERRLREAKEQGKNDVRMSAGERVGWANRLAYGAYLADQDLESRWRELTEVLRQNSLEDQFALYRSQALRMVGRSQQALAVVTQTLQRLEQRLENEEKDLELAVGMWLSQPSWPPDTEPVLLRFKRNNMLEMRLMLRVLYRQALAIGQDLRDDAVRQRYESQALAFQGDVDHFSFDLSVTAVARQLVSIAAYLDTRGSLATKLGRWADAQADLDASIEACYLARAISAETGLVNSPNVVDARVIRVLERELDQMLAAFHFHRALLAEAQEQTESAERDYAAIRRLGWEPGPDLH